MDDRWIDAVAREMTEGLPPDDLKARVMARITAREVDRSWPMAVRLAPAAMALVAAAALTVAMWPERPREAESQVRSEPNPTALGGTGAEAPITRGPEVSVAPRPDLSPDRRPRTASAIVPDQFSAATTTGMAPDGLTIPPMGLDAIGAEDSPVIGPLDVATLSVTRLEIEPIGFPGDLQ